MKNPDKIYRMVLGDYGSEEEVGIIAVNEHPTKSDIHDDTENHWVIMPDGKLRTWYNHRDISASDFDILKSFNSLPELKYHIDLFPNI